MKKIILILICISVFLTGCISIENNIQPDLSGLTPEEQVEVIHKTNLQYILNEDAKAIAAAYSDNYRDLGGGPNGDGTTTINTVNYWSDVFSSNEFDKISDKSLDELVDLSQTEIYTYSDFGQYNSFFCEKTNIDFNCADGDILIIFQPTDNSPLFDGWIGVYREISNEWKIVAGD